MKLEGRVAIVTGGGSGIGRATAVLLAREGAGVVVADISKDGGEETVKRIRAGGGEATFVGTDVSDPGDVERLVDSTIERYRGLDIVHNSAGVVIPVRVTEITDEIWNRTLDINLKGTMLCCKFAIPKMIERGAGSIVNMASMNGLVASPGQSPYCASKGAVVMLTRQMAIDYAPDKIRANCVCPGEVNTPMIQGFLNSTPDPEATRQRLLARIPWQRMAEPEEIARTVLFLASDDASYITGVALPVDGGLTAL